MKQLLYILGLYFKDRSIVGAHTIAVLSLIASSWVLGAKIGQLPNEIPLWYTAEPINQLVEVQWLWLIPGIAALIWLINVIVGLWLYRRYATVSQMLAVVAGATSLLGVIAVIKTVLIFIDLI